MRPAVPALVLGLVVAVACSDGGTEPGRVIALLPLDIPALDVVRRNTATFYAVPVTAGNVYKITLAGLTDDADLYLFDNDGKFTTPADCLVDHTLALALAPESCMMVASADTLYVAVDGNYVAAPMANYTIEARAVPVTDLALSTPLAGTVADGAVKAYGVAVVPGTVYAASVTALTDSAVTLHVENGNDIVSLSHLGAPKDLVRTATGARLYLAVEGTTLSRPTAAYVITTTPAPVVSGPIVGTSGPVPASTPTIGWVATRDESRYQTTGLASGMHIISIVGLTGAVDFHVYSDNTYSFELDCTLLVMGARECPITGTAAYFSVSAGGVNRDGAGYVILVW